MRKKFLPLIICIVILVGLIAAYFVIKNKNSQGEELQEVERSEPIYVLNRSRTDIESIVLENKDINYTFIPADEKRESWVIKDKEDLQVLSSVINSLSYSFENFSVHSRVEAEDIDHANFGFNNPTAVATATYTDGTEEKLLLGNLTPDKEYAYLMHEGDDSVYMIYEFIAQRFTKTMNELIDKSLPAMLTSEISYFFVNQKGRRPIEIAFDGTAEEMVEMYESYGGIALLMLQPFNRREIYTTNLEMYVTNGLQYMTISELVEVEPNEYGKYGLDEPELELAVANVYGEVLHLYLGDETDDGYVYCRIGERSEVFKIAKSNVQSYYDIDLFKFIARFAALINILTVEQVTVVSEQASYTLNINHGIIKATEEGGTDIEIITPVVNGVLVDESDFRKAYESIVAISYDTMIDQVEVSGKPEITITYKLNTGEPDVVVELYGYNSDFYTISNGEGVSEFVTNKFGIRTMFERIEGLIKK